MNGPSLYALRVALDVTGLEWMDRGLCAETDPESFFPEKGGSTREAKKTCLACEVRPECLEYALAQSQDKDFGIWGATSEQERRRMRRERAAAVRDAA